MAFFSTREAANLLKLKPAAINNAIFQNKVEPPMKSPSGDYLWQIEDIERLSWALSHKPFDLNGGK